MARTDWREPCDETLRAPPPVNMIGGHQPKHQEGPVTDTDCLFCKIASGEIPATLVHDGRDVVAFRDIHPQAPVHVLVIPREHLGSLDEVGEAHREILGTLHLTAAEIARKEGIAEGGYRTVLNVGADGGQSVGHVHLHVLGGRAMGWPPG
jgi:histidine triad (HIT) family protein